MSDDNTIMQRKGYTLKSEVLYDTDNKPITIWRKIEKMAIVPIELSETVFYLYPTVESAAKDLEIGGTGFFVRHNDFVYAVTNRHVIEKDEAIVIRVNNHEGTVEIIDVSSAHWKFHNDNVTDVAIARIDTENLEATKYRCINSNVFLSKDIIEQIELGMGNDVFMVGRFVHQSGKEFNTPAARKGMISLPPIEGQPVKLNRIEQEAFLIEMQSICGFSGSPVFHKTHILSNAEYRAKSIGDFDRETIPDWLWLVGIDAGHFRNPMTRINSGISVVIPAWKILEVLNHIEKSQ